MRHIVVLTGILLLLLALALPTVSQGQELPDDQAVGDADLAGENGRPTNQIIIRFSDAATEAYYLDNQTEGALPELSAAAGVPLAYIRPMSMESHVLRLPALTPYKEVAQIAAELSQLEGVAYAEPDRIYTLDRSAVQTLNSPELVPTDTRWSDMWHLRYVPGTSEGVNMVPAWDLYTGSASTVVAVIDTGILAHNDLAGKTVPGYDFIGDVFVANDGNGRDSDPSDPGDWVLENECGYPHSAQSSSWHGTHVAGTIGAATNNNLGIAGVNWNAKILPVRVLGKCGGYTSDIVDGMRWSAGLSVVGVPPNPYPAKVLNLSLGGEGTCSTSEQNAINSIVGAGKVIVVAAGNSNVNVSNFSPANCNNVIAVAATNRTGNKASYSNFGNLIKVSGPGGESSSNGVLSTLDSGTQGPNNSHTYAFYMGTSMAAPHVAGVASLIVGLRPGYTQAQVLSLLQNTARAFPAGSTCNTSNCGSGIVDAYRALQPLTFVATDFLYLPLTTSSVPAPVLQAISNPDGDGNYSVAWGALAGATAYVLEEDDNVGFNSPAVVYNGPNTSRSFTGKSVGTYYYRVKAVFGFQNSGWSNTRSVVVSPPVVVVPLVNPGFESGATGWTQFSTHGWQLIINSGFPGSITPRSGSWLAWLGGDYNDVSYVQQQVTIPAGTPYLAYWHWIASADYCGYDFARVRINGTNVHSYDLCESANTGGWVKKVVNLSAYANQTVTLQVRVETDGSLNSNLFLDDFAFQATAVTSDEPLIFLEDVGETAVPRSAIAP
jgi:serine protease